MNNTLLSRPSQCHLSAKPREFFMVRVGSLKSQLELA